MDGRVRTAQITIVEDNPGYVRLVRKALEEKGIICAGDYTRAVIRSSIGSDRIALMLIVPLARDRKALG